MTSDQRKLRKRGVRRRNEEKVLMQRMCLAINPTMVKRDRSFPLHSTISMVMAR